MKCQVWSAPQTRLWFSVSVFSKKRKGKIKRETWVCRGLHAIQSNPELSDSKQQCEWYASYDSCDGCHYRIKSRQPSCNCGKASFALVTKTIHDATHQRIQSVLCLPTCLSPSLSVCLLCFRHSTAAIDVQSSFLLLMWVSFSFSWGRHGRMSSGKCCGEFSLQDYTHRERFLSVCKKSTPTHQVVRTVLKYWMEQGQIFVFPGLLLTQSGIQLGIPSHL